METDKAIMVVNPPIVEIQSKQKKVLASNEEPMRIFQEFLRLEQVSQKTVKQYHSQVKDFLLWCYDNRVNVVTATYKDILEYRFYLTSKGLSKSTRQSRLVTVRRFFKALQNEGLRIGNPTDGVKSGKNAGITDKERAERVKYLSESELQSMLNEAAKSNKKTMARNQAAIVLMGCCGLRGCEVINIRRKDVDCIAHTVSINGKGDLKRKTGMTASQFKYIQALLDVIPNDQDSFLFVNTSNKKGSSPQLTVRGLRLMIDTIMGKLKIKKNGRSSHSLRHGCAMALYRHGVPIEKISAQLGHEKINTTMIYVRVMDTIENPVSSVLDCLVA